MVASLGRRSSIAPGATGEQEEKLGMPAQRPQPYPEGAIDQFKILDHACDVQVRWRASNRARRRMTARFGLTGASRKMGKSSSVELA